MGRPPLPENLKDLICTMARDNPTWGEERIANEFSVKLGMQRQPAVAAAKGENRCSA